jgi:hypothetical protein
LYVHRQVYITQLLTNGTHKFPSHPPLIVFYMMVGIFSNALYIYAPRCRTFPKKDGWGWVYKSNRSHLRVLLVKNTNIMYIYFLNFKSHLNWNMLIGCFLIDIARLIEKWVKMITEIGVFIRGEKLQLVSFEMWLLSRKRERKRERKKMCVYMEM